MMSTFRDFSLPEMYEAIRSKDILPEIDCSIDWESIRPMIRSLFHNNTEKVGRPNLDEIVMIKALFLQGLYSIVDEKLEKELYDRISFHNFIHLPDKMPNARILWALRERMSSTGMDKYIWSELWRQLESKGIVIRKGVIQDASFITSNHGKHGRKKPPAPDMPEPSETQSPVDLKEAEGQASATREEKKRLRKDMRRESMTGRPKDGTFTQKDGKNFFGYKQHSSHGVDMPLVREFVITTASVHDSQVDLSVPGIPCYRTRGYNSADNVRLIENRKYIGALVLSDHSDLLDLPVGEDSFIETEKTVYGRKHRIILYHSSKLQRKRIISFMKKFRNVYIRTRNIIESGDSDSMVMCSL